MRTDPPSEGFIPKSMTALRGYTGATFLADLVAGLTVSLVALPLAMAFAIASGVAPQAGLYCAIVAGFIISALGGSRFQIGGPTISVSLVVTGVVATYGMSGLFMCTLMAGVFLILLGWTGLGLAVKYIPRPVIMGFTNGIAVLIASTQIKDFLGLTIDHVPADFLGRMTVIIRHLGGVSWTATITAIGCVLLMVAMRRMRRRLPGAILALVVGTAVVWIGRLPVATIASRYGGIPAGVPRWVIPTFRPELFLPLMAPALTVTMLVAIESLLSAVVADRMSNSKHNPSMELVAVGIANVVSPLFGGLPATGAAARTGTNIRSGARTPAAGMIHAIALLLILVVAAPVAGHIPLCVLAAILMMVAYAMGQWREIPEILRLSFADISVWLITFALTVLADLSVAVEAGMILAGLLYIRKVTSTTNVTEITPEYVAAGFAHSLQTNPLPPGTAAFRIHGPFLFGATDKLRIIEEQIDTLPKVVLLRLRNMNAIDATGVNALERLADALRQSGRHLVVCGMRDQPAQLMGQAEFHRHLGEANIQPTLASAIARAKELLAESEV